MRFHSFSSRLDWNGSFDLAVLAPSQRMDTKDIHDMHPSLLRESNAYLEPEPRISVLGRPTTPETQQKQGL